MRQKTVDLAIALIVGAIAAAVLWVAGAPDLAWLGFVAAGLAYAGESRGCRARLRRASR